MGAGRRVPRLLRTGSPARGRAAVVGLTVVMAAATALLWRSGIDPSHAVLDPAVPWWLLAPFFFLADAHVVSLRLNRSVRDVTLSELPLAVALLMASPAGTVAAVLVGSGAVYAGLLRQEPVKLLFNLVLKAFGASVMILVVQSALAPGLAPGPVAWAVVIGALMVGAAVDSLLVTVVIAAHDDSVGPWDAVREVLRYQLVTPLVGCLGLVAVTTLHADRRAAWLLAALVAGAIVAYRAHGALSERHVALTTLHDFGQALGRAADTAGIVAVGLSGALGMMRADEAQLVLLAPRHDEAARRWRLDARGVTTVDEVVAGHPARWEDVLGGGGPQLATRKGPAAGRLAASGLRDAVVVPLVEEDRVIGSLMVGANRRGVGPFREADVRSLATLGNQMGLALRTSRLLDRLRYEATHDALTGLANRTLFRRGVANELEHVAAAASPGCAVLLLDLDGFKQVNDSLGHHAGDALLIHVADRLREAAGPADMAARLGGDEFALLLTSLDDAGSAARAGEAVLRTIARPLVLDGIEVAVRGSVGIAVAEDAGVDASALLKQADVAMYEAKSSGGGVRTHRHTDEGSAQHELEVLADLRRAVVDGGLAVHVQPQARAATREVVAVEALVRWNHPRLGVLGPGRFLALAERNGLMPRITESVVDAAVAAVAAWRAEGIELRISVNVPPRSLLDRRTPGMLAAALQRHGVPGHLLTVEITEDALLHDVDGAVVRLGELRAAGVRVAVDDFGTGYSSLSYLSRLPADEVKIDGSFVRSLTGNEGALLLTRSIIDLGRNLRLDVVAEAVEDEATWLRLAGLGVDLVQGDHLSRPMPVADLVPWLASYQSRTAVIPRQAPSGGGAAADVAGTDLVGEVRLPDHGDAEAVPVPHGHDPGRR